MNQYVCLFAAASVLLACGFALQGKHPGWRVAGLDPAETQTLAMAICMFVLVWMAIKMAVCPVPLP